MLFVEGEWQIGCSSMISGAEYEQLTYITSNLTKLCDVSWILPCSSILVVSLTFLLQLAEFNPSQHWPVMPSIPISSNARKLWQLWCQICLDFRKWDGSREGLGRYKSQIMNMQTPLESQHAFKHTPYRINPLHCQKLDIFLQYMKMPWFD